MNRNGGKTQDDLLEEENGQDRERAHWRVSICTITKRQGIAP